MGDDVDDEPVRKKKKRKREQRSRSKSRSDVEEDIDDDDRELLKENLGIDFVKKRKRIRMESGSEDSASEGEADHQDEIPDLDDKPGDESDPDDFIVDADGKPLRTERKKKKTHLFQDEERQMAEDIFGVKFDYGEFEQYGDDEEMEEDYEEDLEVRLITSTFFSILSEKIFSYCE